MEKEKEGNKTLDTDEENCPGVGVGA